MARKKCDDKAFYKLLGVEPTATPQEIKTAYRRLAIQFHPDKNPDPEAAEKFKEISVAYAILSDPNKRHRYDQGEMETAEVDSLDLAALGLGSKLMVAFLSKVGVNMPTAVSPKVLSEAQQQQGTALALRVNAPPLHRKLSNQKADFFSVHITEEQAAAGVSVQVWSKGSNRFKLLYFDSTASLQHTADSYSQGKAGSFATMDFCAFSAYHFDRTAAASIMLQPEDDLPPVFRQLDSYGQSRFTRLAPGTHLLGVFADNFFLQLHYTIGVTTCTSDVVPEIVSVEQDLLQRKQFLQDFEFQYVQAKAAYDKARETMEEQAKHVHELLHRRDELYGAYRRPAA